LDGWIASRSVLMVVDVGNKRKAGNDFVKLDFHIPGNVLEKRVPKDLNNKISICIT